MRALKPLLLCFSLALAVPALAAPNTSSGGQKCEESSSNVKHNIKGKDYNCDKCVYSQCDSSGGSISNCKRVTEWSNCVEAAGSGAGGGGKVNVDRMAPPKNPQKPGAPAGTNKNQ
jgi:hypothetical protein